LKEVGIFGVCAMFATMIRIPYNSISKIATGIIAEAWKRDDRVHIQEIYQKSTLNQAIIGTLIFIGIIVNIDNIFKILPPNYNSGRWVLVIYSVGILISTTIGLAGTITETSRHFKFNTLFLVISIISQFVLYSLLIPEYGITGAALATMITLVLNAFLQVILQKTVFGIFGGSYKLFWIAFFGILSSTAVWLLPQMSLVADILVRSGLVTLIFGGLVFFTKISLDANEVITSFAKKVFPFSSNLPPFKHS
jgi:O-antigen/teichoic acid export membrane protein